MRETKREVSQALFYDAEGVAAHLEKMAGKGWLLTQIGRVFWTYRRIEPKTLRFAATYFPDASDFDPGPTRDQQTLMDYCGSAGWTFAARWGQMFLFWTADRSAAPIETDEALKLRTVHAGQKRNFLPWSVVILLLAVVDLWSRASAWQVAPVWLLADGIGLVVMLDWAVLALYELAVLGGYLRWYFRSKRAVERGGVCASVGKTVRNAGYVLAVAVAALVFCLVWQGVARGAGPRLAAVAGCYVLLLAAVLGLRNLLRAHGVSRTVNRVITFVLAAVLGVAFAAIPFRAPPRPEVTAADLPLVVQDLLGGMPSEEDFFRWQSGSSPLMAYSDCEYYLENDAESVQYEIDKPGLSVLYGLCLDKALELFPYQLEAGAAWVETAPAPWGAETAYELRYTEREPEAYVLCWPDRVVKVYFTWPPTAEQMAVAGEKLGNA